MKTLRIEAALESRLEQAAAASGETLSEFIRRAAAARADRVLSAEPLVELDGIIGAVHSDGGRARRTGAAFAAGLAADRRAQASAG